MRLRDLPALIWDAIADPSWLVTTPEGLLIVLALATGALFVFAASDGPDRIVLWWHAPARHRLRGRTSVAIDWAADHIPARALTGRTSRPSTARARHRRGDRTP